MIIHVVHVQKNMTIIRTTPDTTSVKDYIIELANEYVDSAVTEDCALNKPVSDYITTHDGDTKSRVFRDGELVLSIMAQ